MAVGQSEYRETFPRLAAGQVWIANCPTTMIESAPGESPWIHLSSIPAASPDRARNIRNVD